MLTKGSKKLAAWLEKQGLTQEEFAHSAGCTGASVCQWLSGVRRPNVDSAFTIEAITDGAVLASDWRHDASVHTRNVNRKNGTRV